MWFKYGLKTQKLLTQGVWGRNLRNFSISAKAAVFDKTTAFSCFS